METNISLNEDTREIYSKMEERIPFLEHNDARARKWSILTGWKDAKHPGLIEEKYMGPARIATEMQLEETVYWLSRHPAMSHYGKKLCTMHPIQVQEAIDSSAVEPYVTYALSLIRRL